MGMDVRGLHPAAAGRYYTSNRWCWLALVSYITQFGPHHLVHKFDWGYNDGDGLNGNESAQLAKWLKEELASGAVGEYQRRRDEYIAAIPKTTCGMCDGTGVRPSMIGVATALPNETECPVCGGRGERCDEECYGFSEERVTEFAAFLEASGGFEIW